LGGPEGMVEVTIDAPIGPADVAGLWERVRARLAGGDAAVVVCDVAALTDPDAGTVEALCRLQLAARRSGRRIRLRRVGPRLRGLLDLMGLCEAVPGAAPLAVEPQGQAEEGEQPGGVQEEGDPGDPAP
jgi:ABC-type transporter Mla MlaB component